MSTHLGCQSSVFTTSGHLNNTSWLSIHQLVPRGGLSVIICRQNGLYASPLPQCSHRTPLPPGLPQDLAQYLAYGIPRNDYCPQQTKHEAWCNGLLILSCTVESNEPSYRSQNSTCHPRSPHRHHPNIVNKAQYHLKLLVRVMSRYPYLPAVRLKLTY